MSVIVNYEYDFAWEVSNSSFATESPSKSTSVYAIVNGVIWMNGPGRTHLFGYSTDDGSLVGSIDIASSVGGIFGQGDLAVDQNGYIWLAATVGFIPGRPSYVIVDPATQTVVTTLFDAGDATYGDFQIKFDSTNNVMWVMNALVSIDAISTISYTVTHSIASVGDMSFAVDGDGTVWVHNSTADTLKTYNGSNGALLSTPLASGATMYLPRAIFIPETNEMLFTSTNSSKIEIWDVETETLTVSAADSESFYGWHYLPLTDEIYGYAYPGFEVIRFYDRATLVKTRDIAKSGTMFLSSSLITESPGNIYGSTRNTDGSLSTLFKISFSLGAPTYVITPTTENAFPNAFNRELILDLTLQAFSVYDFQHAEDDDAPRIHDYIPISKTVKEAVDIDVLDNLGVIVTDSAAANVTVSTLITSNRTRDVRTQRFKYLVSQSNSVTLAEFRDYSFVDWKSYNSVGFDASANLFTGYDLSNDLLRVKQALYIIVHCNRTETVYNLVDGVVIPVIPSSCLVQAQWGFNDSITQGKWGTQFEAYRLFLPQVASPSSGDAFIYGPRVITTKNKLRGRGDALSLYFQTSPGKDFQLLGWGILGTVVDAP